MYKVFFKDRRVDFGSNFPDLFREKEGLFYRYGNANEMRALVMAFSDLTEIKHLYISGNDLEQAWKDFKAAFLNIEAAGGLVKNREGAYLFIRRNGVWDLPKGKKDKHEKIEEAAVREVMEETGLRDVEIRNFLTTTYHSYVENGRIILKHTNWYLMGYSGNEVPVPEIAENITEVRWIKPAEIGEVQSDTYASLKEVISFALSN